MFEVSSTLKVRTLFGSSWWEHLIAKAHVPRFKVSLVSKSKNEGEEEHSLRVWAVPEPALTNTITATYLEVLQSPA